MGAHERGAWSHEGHSLAAKVFDPRPEPCLVGEGSLIAGTPMNHFLANGLPGATAALFVGLSRIDATFKQGVLVPSPDIVKLRTLNGSGASSAPVVWPAGIPSGTELFVQYWVVDGSGPAGLVASNAVVGVTP